MKRFLSVAFWSVIAAAFIGPGTVTSAAMAGADFGLALLWALLFSTVATIVLQEAAARVAMVSGHDLGEAIRRRFRAGAFGVPVMLLVLGAIVLGNAAYEAGNILGAVAGAGLGLDLTPRTLTLLTGAGSALILWMGSPRGIARLLSLTVAVMGIAMIGVAWLLRPPLGALLAGSLVPTIPDGSLLIILALVGTTVVPYNLFLGSGIAGGDDLRLMRFGIAIAVLLGGMISMAIVVVGTALAGEFGFEALAATLAERLGSGGPVLLGAGLFAAGFSSAVTAPLAASITARGLLSDGRDDARWQPGSWRYRAVWMGVLAVGIAFGLSGVRPVPVIVVAQALNGVLLPFAAFFLYVVVNDRALLGARANGPVANLVAVMVVAVAATLGSASVVRALATAAGWTATDSRVMVGIPLAVGAAAIAAAPIVVARRKRGAATEMAGPVALSTGPTGTE